MIKFVRENNGNHKWCMNLHEEIVFVYVVDKIYEYEKNTRVFVEKSRNIFLKVVFNIFRNLYPRKGKFIFVKDEKEIEGKSTNILNPA